MADLAGTPFDPGPGALDPGPAAVGTWSGGRFMHFGEPLDDERFIALITPDESIRTVMTADAYGAGEADRMLGRAIDGRTRSEMCVVGAVGHDFYEGERDGPRGFPRFTDPGLRDASGYADYLRMATERSLERCGIDSFDLLLLHNPDRTGYTSEVVWEGMAGLREAGLTRLIGVAPGPANGFTLDLIDCLERFGALLDWAMIILNPLEPWPGELCLDAAAAAGVKVITRVVDYGGLFFDDLVPGQELARQDHRSFRPAGWIELGRERLERMRPVAERTGLTMIQLACQWNMAHAPVACVVPTLIQETGPGARSVESKRAELAALPAQVRLTAMDVDEIRSIGDNTGCMALKGASPEHSGDERPDRWDLDDRLAAVAVRWGIAPERQLVKVP
ncbi:MAG TPA: aldo/keto reductase [Solirubrobacteraceae bacterium]|jgi:aryl-alcohol dehydrogenase-like predicted oxidoreductase